MTPLRQRMLEDMQLRGLAPKTGEAIGLPLMCYVFFFTITIMPLNSFPSKSCVTTSCFSKSRRRSPAAPAPLGARQARRTSASRRCSGRGKRSTWSDRARSISCLLSRRSMKFTASSVNRGHTPATSGLFERCLWLWLPPARRDWPAQVRDVDSERASLHIRYALALRNRLHVLLSVSVLPSPARLLVHPSSSHLASPSPNRHRGSGRGLPQRCTAGVYSYQAQRKWRQQGGLRPHAAPQLGYPPAGSRQGQPAPGFSSGWAIPRSRRQPPCTPSTQPGPAGNPRRYRHQPGHGRLARFAE